MLSSKAWCAVGLVVVVTSCGQSSSEQVATVSPITIPGVDLPGLDELPEAQRSAFADGAITTAEYASAYRAFEVCANSGGRPAVLPQPVDPVSGYQSYGIFEDVGGSLEDPASASGRCYESEFHWIELVWEGTDPTYTEQQGARQLDQINGEGRACLTANGVDVPSDIELRSETYIQLVQAWAELANAGKC